MWLEVDFGVTGSPTNVCPICTASVQQECQSVCVHTWGIDDIKRHSDFNFKYGVSIDIKEEIAI